MFEQECRKCGKTGHFPKRCKSKANKDSIYTKDSKTTKDDEGSNMLFAVRSEEVLYGI